MFIKLCGLKTPADVEAATRAGADAIGFVFASSVRQVSPDLARELAAAVPAHILTVGVFKGAAPEEVARTVAHAGLTAVQLHGRHPRSDFAALAELKVPLLRAISIEEDQQIPRVGDFGEDMLLLDAPHAGAGRRWDTSRLAGNRPEGPWLLAGGLNTANVGAAVAAARPWGVDVSSGIESAPGVKDPALIRAFVTAARAAGAAVSEG